MQEKVVLDEDDIRRTLVRIAHEIVEKNAGRPVALVGIHRRGAHLAQRLQALGSGLVDEEVPLGDLDIAFYRDDLAIRESPVVNATHLDFPLEDHTVVVVDKPGDQRVQPLGEMRAAAVDAHEGERPAGVLLDDLVRDAHQRPADVVLVEDDPAVFGHTVPSWPLRAGLKGLAGG